MGSLRSLVTGAGRDAGRWRSLNGAGSDAGIAISVRISGNSPLRFHLNFMSIILSAGIQWNVELIFDK